MAVTFQEDRPIATQSKCGSTLLLHLLDLVMGWCYESTIEAVSSLLGYMSIFFWLNAQVPQLYTNYLLGSAASLSLPFLLIWLLGDITNFLGCILTNQLPFQRYLALYFCLIDLSLLIQFFYYEHGWSTPISSSPISSNYVEASPSSQRESVHFDLHEEDEEDEDDEEGEEGGERQRLTASFHSSASQHHGPQRSIRERARIAGETWGEEEEEGGRRGGWRMTLSERSPLARHSLVKYYSLTSQDRAKHLKKIASVSAFSIGLLLTSQRFLGETAEFDQSSPSPHRVLDKRWIASPSTMAVEEPIEDGMMLNIGVVMAWTCTCLYLASRIPQIVLNYTRGTAEGLSIWMFAFAALGNLTYVLSIALHIEGSEEWLNALPYIIGSAGTLSFDATIFAQFWYYRKLYASYS